MNSERTDHAGTSLIDWFRVAAIPLSVAIGGWSLAWFSQDRTLNAGNEALQAQYVQLATDILREPLPSGDETPDAAAQLSLREWAADVLAFGSPVPLSSDTRDALATGDASLPRTSCDPNYGGCVPIATDVDCVELGRLAAATADGSDDGPRFTSGPVAVLGVDIYQLDQDGDGIACETA